MQLTRTEILDKLKDILHSADEVGTTPIDNCTEESNLSSDLGLSSVGMLYMVISIEETFDVRFENVSILDFVTIKDVIDYICR